MKLKHLAAGIAMAASSSAAFAATPTLADVLGASGITAAGYVDAGYYYLDTDGAFTSGFANRVFDTEDNGFMLNQVGLSFSKLPADGFGGLVNVTMGSDADVIAAAGTGGGQYAGNDNFDVTQAFVQYASGPLTVMAGKFVTLAGAEVIWSPSVPNVSRSILFGYAIPFGHTGVRVSYKVSDALTLIGGVNNGWDAQKDNNEQKTGEVGLILAPGPAFTLGVFGYAGQEPISATENTDRYLVDVVATFNATKALTLILNGDWGTQEAAAGSGLPDNDWSGLAAYANLKTSDTCRVSLRAEYLDDDQGFRTGVPQTWKEVTLTGAVAPSSNVELLAEVRSDFSDKDSFADGGKVDDSQLGGGVKVIYKF